MKNATVNNVKAGTVLIHADTKNRLTIQRVEKMTDVDLVFWFGNNPGDYLLPMNLRDWYVA